MIFNFLLLGILTDLTNAQDPFFVCEDTAWDKLVAGLVDLVGVVKRSG